VLGIATAISGSAPASPPEPEKTENRSDSGQFRSDSIQNSSRNSHPPWSLQRNEPAIDYLLFAAWLQLPAPRHLRKAVATLGCSLHRLRQLSAQLMRSLYFQETLSVWGVQEACGQSLYVASEPEDVSFFNWPRLCRGRGAAAPAGQQI